MNHYLRNKQSLWPVVLGIDGHKLGKDQKSANYPSLSCHPAAWEHDWHRESNTQPWFWQSSVNTRGFRATVTFRIGEGCWVFGVDSDWRGLYGLLSLKGQRSPATSCPGCLARNEKGRAALVWWPGKRHQHWLLQGTLLWWILVDLLARQPFPSSGTSGKLTVFLGSRRRHKKSTGQECPHWIPAGTTGENKFSIRAAHIMQHLLMLLAATSATSQWEPVSEWSWHRWKQSQEVRGQRGSLVHIWSSGSNPASVKPPHLKLFSYMDQ